MENNTKLLYYANVLTNYTYAIDINNAPNTVFHYTYNYNKFNEYNEFNSDLDSIESYRYSSFIGFNTDMSELNNNILVNNAHLNSFDSTYICNNLINFDKYSVTNNDVMSYNIIPLAINYSYISEEYNRKQYIEMLINKYIDNEYSLRTPFYISITNNDTKNSDNQTVIIQSVHNTSNTPYYYWGDINEFGDTRYMTQFIDKITVNISPNSECKIYFGYYNSNMSYNYNTYQSLLYTINNDSDNIYNLEKKIDDYNCKFFNIQNNNDKIKCEIGGNILSLIHNVIDNNIQTDWYNKTYLPQSTVTTKNNAANIYYTTYYSSFAYMFNNLNISSAKKLFIPLTEITTNNSFLLENFNYNTNDENVRHNIYTSFHIFNGMFSNCSYLEYSPAIMSTYTVNNYVKYDYLCYNCPSIKEIYLFGKNNNNININNNSDDISTHTYLCAYYITYATRDDYSTYNNLTTKYLYVNKDMNQYTKDYIRTQLFNKDMAELKWQLIEI